MPAPAVKDSSVKIERPPEREAAWRIYEAARNAFLARLRRRDPQAAALQGEPQLMLLSQRFPDVPASEIRDALLPPFANDPAAFRTRIATLIRLRNRL